MSFPVDFPESNVLLRPPPGIPEEECGCLYVHASPETNQWISCWQLSREELAEVLRSGRVYLHVFGGNHPPVAISGIRPFPPVLTSGLRPEENAPPALTQLRLTFVEEEPEDRAGCGCGCDSGICESEEEPEGQGKNNGVFRANKREQVSDDPKHAPGTSSL